MLALGNFDGLHRGHRKILDRLRRVAEEPGATSVIMTFDPHPPRVVRPDKAPPLLMTKAQKLEALQQYVPTWYFTSFSVYCFDSTNCFAINWVVRW